MRRWICAVLTVAACGSSAHAAPPDRTAGSHIDVFYAAIDATAEAGGEKASIDGDGGGMRMWLGNGPGVFTAEFGTGKADGTVRGARVEGEISDIRAGLGWRFIHEPSQAAWIRAEYISAKAELEVEDASAEDDQDGYGVQVGGLLGSGIFHGYGEVGRVDLSDLDGWEYKVGVALQPGLVGGFAEYQLTDLELDNFDVDEEFEVVKLGLRIAFD